MWTLQAVQGPRAREPQRRGDVRRPDADVGVDAGVRHVLRAMKLQPVRVEHAAALHHMLALEFRCSADDAARRIASHRHSLSPDLRDRLNAIGADGDLRDMAAFAHLQRCTVVFLSSANDFVTVLDRDMHVHMYAMASWLRSEPALSPPVTRLFRNGDTFEALRAMRNEEPEPPRRGVEFPTAAAAIRSEPGLPPGSIQA